MGSHASDPKLLPVPYKPPATGRLDIEHQLHEWTSGTRGGGVVPQDFTWVTNPKQTQEELGAAEAEKPLGR
ncbi:MAG: hypothetical protein IT380_12225 [Myxococcales bacterium]|nr:hypothetical protein [Myxococcales bacterium]